jgi:hypothetical protein
MGDTYCCVGLAASAQAFAALGMPRQAERFRAEAAAYRADILASMRAATFTDRGMPLLPMEPETRRLLRSTHNGGGDYYGLVASCVLENGFLEPEGPEARLITDLMERRDGLLCGLCRFGSGGVDHAYTYGYLFTQLRRGEVREFLLGFYAMLAYGMSRDTYSGVECTTAVTGENAQTLPHLYSCTQQLETLRAMLVREEGGRTLMLADGIPRAWLQDGKRVVVRRAPTRFGVVSYSIRSRVSRGRITADVRLPRGAGITLCLRLRHPHGLPIREVTVRGAEQCSVAGGELVRVACQGGHVSLTATYRGS